MECLNNLQNCGWLNLLELGNLDMGILNHSLRKPWLNILKGASPEAANVWLHSHLSMKWIITRSIRISQVLLDHKHCFKLSDGTFEAIGVNDLRSASIDSFVTATKLLPSEGYNYLRSIDLTNCRYITDVALSALAHGCHQL
jgi:hypothetical protein